MRNAHYSIFVNMIINLIHFLSTFRLLSIISNPSYIFITVTAAPARTKLAVFRPWMVCFVPFITTSRAKLRAFRLTAFRAHFANLLRFIVHFFDDFWRKVTEYLRSEERRV